MLHRQKSSPSSMLYLSLFLGLILSVTGCGQDGGDNLTPTDEALTVVEARSIQELLRLYGEALQNEDIDRLENLLSTQGLSIQDEAQNPAPLSHSESGTSFITVDAFQRDVTNAFRSLTFIDVELLDTDMSLAADSPSVSFLEVQRVENAAAWAQETRVLRTTLQITRDEADGIVTLRIAAVKREGPLVRVMTRGQVLIGAPMRVEVVDGLGAPPITGGAVTVPETGAGSELVAADGAFHVVVTAPERSDAGPLRVNVQREHGETMVVDHRYRLQERDQRWVIQQIPQATSQNLFSVALDTDGNAWFGGEAQDATSAGYVIQLAADGQLLRRGSLTLDTSGMQEAIASARITDIVIDTFARIHFFFLAQNRNGGVIANGDLVEDPNHVGVPCQTVNPFDSNQAYPFYVTIPETGEVVRSPSTQAISAGDGALWLFGSDGGVAQAVSTFSIRDRQCETINVTFSSPFHREEDGLLSNSVLALVGGTNRPRWFGTAIGLQDEQFNAVPFRRGLVFPPEDVATLEGLFSQIAQAIFDARPIVRVGNIASQLIKGDLISSVVEDTPGTLWASTYGAGIRRIEGGQDRLHVTRNRVERIDPESGERTSILDHGLGSNLIFALALGPDDAVWAATAEGVSRIEEQGDAVSITSFSVLDGLAVPVRDVAVNPDDETVWVATAEGAFRIIRKGAQVSGMVQDTQGEPVVGADVTVARTPFRAVTDETGHFVLANLPPVIVLANLPPLTPPMAHHLHITGGLAADGPFTTAYRQVELTAEDQTLPPIVLTHREDAVEFNPEQGGVITFPTVLGAKLEIPPGGVTFPDGAKPRIGLTLLPFDNPPLPLDRGRNVIAVAELQPDAMSFTEPMTLTLPVQRSLPAAPSFVLLECLRQNTLIYEGVGPGQVSEDGTTVTASGVTLGQCAAAVFEAF